MNEFPDWLSSTLASDANEGQGVLTSWIGSLKPDARAVGPAFVVLMSRDDNLSVREAIRASPRPGSILVIADEDGVVIWPKEHIDTLLGKVDAKRQEDNARLAQLQQDIRQERQM